MWQLLAEFSAMDLDGDGLVDRSEFSTIGGSQAMFDVLDKDGDGKLDQEEMQMAVKQLIERLEDESLKGVQAPQEAKTWTLAQITAYFEV